jgi:hypothetical protein
VAKYSYTELETLWIGAGGPVNEAPTAAAIAMAESGGVDTAANPSGATGLWQILGYPSGVTGNLKNPGINARAAVAKYKQAPNGGNNFTPWVTYTTGAYKQYLKNVLPPTTNDFGGGAGTGGTNAVPKDYTILGIDTGQGINSSPLNTAVTAGAGVENAVTSVPKFLGEITDPANLLRAGKIALGAVLLLVGVIELGKVGFGVDVPKTAGKVAGLAA